MDPPTTANRDQIDYWNADAGNAWARLQARMDAQIGPLGEAGIDALNARPGERVFDIGCGCGDTTLALARRVVPGGAVTGIDVSRPMLEVARRRAAEIDAVVEFLEADASSHGFEPAGADAIFSRFGVMFFADPASAFAHMRAALKPGGRIAFVCWQAPALNPFITAPMAVARPLLAPEPPPDLNAPGPFAFADRDRVADILKEAGFARIEITPRQRTIDAGSPEQALENALGIGPVARALREQPDRRDAAVAAIRQDLAGRAGPDGQVRFDTATWVATATNPE